MVMTIGRASRRGLVIGVLALVVIVGGVSPALAAGCAAVGTFAITVTEGAGMLSLRADGTASMVFVLGHSNSELIDFPGFIFNGTYQTQASAQGCFFTIDWTKPPAPRDQIVGIIAFEGRVLMFVSATKPGYGNGLGLRQDTLTGQ
jgi:hypothetical protein